MRDDMYDVRPGPGASPDGEDEEFTEAPPDLDDPYERDEAEEVAADDEGVYRGEPFEEGSHASEGADSPEVDQL